jgi:hypothetical protein
MMQANDENVPIQLWLAGRSYRIRVRAADAERIQRSIKLADEKITELKLNYAGKDDQDFIAMCLIMYASESNGNNSIDITADLKKLSQDIDDLLA